MNFEKKQGNNEPSKKESGNISPENKKRAMSGKLEAGESPDAFARKVGLFIEATFSNVETIGEENLESIPADRRVIFVTTHITNSDVPVALSVLGKKFHVAAGDASTHHNISENTFAFIGSKLAGGDENLIPVSHRRTAESGETGVFNPEDFEEMKGAFEKNNAVVLAAYYKDRNEDLELPEKGGYGAAYLAGIADAVIVPVAVNIKSKEHINTPLSALKAAVSRPEAEVIIGKAFDLQKTGNLSALKDIMAKRKQGPLSREEVSEFRKGANELRSQSDVLMRHLAELLPESKRGTWSKEK